MILELQPLTNPRKSGAAVIFATFPHMYKQLQRKFIVTLEDPPHYYKNSELTVDAEGTVTCGKRSFKTVDSTIRKEILKIVAQNEKGYLLRKDYTNKLIRDYLRPIDIPTPVNTLRTEPYLRRQNNVDKAISRLRIDLERTFKTDFPDGTSWMSYSKKIDGWLLYRLPSLGCDGEFHS